MIRIKDFKLAFLAIILIASFCSLGNWQLNRAKQKRILIASFTERKESLPRSNADLNDLNKINDLRFYRAKLEGEFDNKRTLLLDNKVFNGRVGYEVYTLFRTKNNLNILVDRGFIPLTAKRSILPKITPLYENTIDGLINTPPSFFSFGDMLENDAKSWPIRVEYLDFKKLPQVLSVNQLFPFVVQLDPKQKFAYPLEWSIASNPPPERHIGYAVQWFALACTLLILSLVLNCSFSIKKDKF